jgi:hypothetical protein
MLRFLGGGPAVTTPGNLAMDFCSPFLMPKQAVCDPRVKGRGAVRLHQCGEHDGRHPDALRP